MPSPFPGMDPYLESPDLWPDVHHGFISQIQMKLNAQLPHYSVRVEKRVYITHEDDPGRHLFIPDVRIEKRTKAKAAKNPKSPATLVIDEPLIVPYTFDPETQEAYLELRDSKSNVLVTVIEILSPTNKIRGSEGRRNYMDKRTSLLASNVHILEIDLLRDGEPPIVPMLPLLDYRIFLSRGNDRRRTWCWPIQLPDKLPVVAVPLHGKEDDAPLDLPSVFDAVYDGGAYYKDVDYTKNPTLPLSPKDAKWANKLLKEKGLR